MAKYKLKKGIVLHPYGKMSRLDNSNLTDEIAEFMIKNGRAKKTDFIIKKNTIKNGNNR